MRKTKVIGSIPEEIVFIYGGKRKIGNWWSDIESDKVHEEVTPAFISDSKNQKTIETGESWAEGGYYNRDKKIVVKKEVMKNDPVEGFKIIDLERRSEGGRAYKILTPNGYYVDLREDVLLDTMLECGIDKGGILKGSFVWARVGSQMKLVRVGSELHDALIEKTEEKKLSNIPTTDLEIGGIYKGRGNACYVYCGRIDTTVLEFIRDGGTTWKGNPSGKIKKKEIKNEMLWYEPYSFKDDKDCKKDFVESLKHGYSFQFNIRKSRSVIKKVGAVDVPVNLIEELKEATTKYVQEEAKRYPHDRNRQQSDESICYRSNIYFMRKAGEPEPVVPEEYKSVMAKST